MECTHVVGGWIFLYIIFMQNFLLFIYLTYLHFRTFRDFYTIWYILTTSLKHMFFCELPNKKLLGNLSKKSLQLFNTVVLLPCPMKAHTIAVSFLTSLFRYMNTTQQNRTDESFTKNLWWCLCKAVAPFVIFTEDDRTSTFSET